MSSNTELLMGAVPFIGALFSVFKALRFVKEGERGAHLRFGKFKREVLPGFVLVIPFVDTIERTHVRQNTVNLPNQIVTLKDNLTFSTSSVVVYHVVDVYKALFEIDKLHDSIINVALTVMRETLSSREYENMHDLKALNTELADKLRSCVKAWGVEITSFELSDFAPTPDTARIMLSIAQVKKQVEGNELLLDHLEKTASRMKELGPLSSIATALIMRGNGQGATPALVVAPERDEEQINPEEKKHIATTQDD